MRVGHVRYYVVAILAMLLYLLGAERQWRLSSLPEHSSLTATSFPARVGDAIAGDYEQLEFLVQAYPIGQALEIHGADTVHSVVLVPTLPMSSLIFMLVNGAFFWIVSVLLFVPRIDRVPARDFYWGFILYGLAVNIGNVYFPMGGIGPSALLSVLRLSAGTILPILLLSISLTFPQRREFLNRAPRLIPTVYLAGLSIIAWQSAILLRYFRSPTPEHWGAMALPAIVQELFLVIMFTAACLSFLVTTRRAKRVRERQQAQLILWGITIGATPFVFLYTLPLVWGSEPILPLAITRLFSIAIPVTFSFTVIWFKFLDVDLILRRGLIYTLLAASMGGIYLLLGVEIGRRVEEAWPIMSAAIPVTATLVPILLFNPTRRLLGWFVDRTFFKIHYDYNQALALFREQIFDVSSQQLLAEALADFLKVNLDVKKVVVLVRGKDQTWIAGSQQPWIVPTALEAFEELLTQHGTIAVPESTSMPEIETTDFPLLYRNVGFRVAQPLRVDTLLGLVIIGDKKVERLYIKRDLRLLADATESTAVAVERMNLVQEVVKEALARNRSDEMNRFKTEFLARVAHDLRSPLTSISWSARNLLDGITGTLTPNQAQYLTGIEASSDQMVRLVNNLLEMNRLEETEVKVAAEPLDVGKIIHATIQKLEPARAAKNVTFDVSVEDDAGWAIADPQALLEVIDNLLENAVKYSPPDSRIEINLATTAERQLRFTIRDHGPGVATEDQERIFARYRQGRPSPYSAKHGFGLGLHVVRAYMELMGGSVSVTNHPDGGAIFECLLPGCNNLEGA